jgi:transcriptional regulator GlxA family with amidase domain
MPKNDHLAEIGLLIYPGARLSAVEGLTDLFLVANQLADAYSGMQRPNIRISHWRQSESGAIEKSYDSHPGSNNRPIMLVVPGCFGEPISSEAAQPCAQWLLEKHSQGATLCSVCGGTFLLAETGLLKGRTATTHWMFIDALIKRFPDIKADRNRLIIDDGDIITAGGFMAWTDLGLRLIHRILGPTLMLSTAQFMLIDPPGREQRYYSSFSPHLHHGDERILKVQHWLQANGARDVSLAAMAGHAGMEERTFLRRFQKATGLKPTEYCQHLRVGKARQLLELSNQSIEQVAWGSGYEDTSAFRKVFFKIVGLTPGEYRTRFRVTHIGSGALAA